MNGSASEGGVLQQQARDEDGGTRNRATCWAWRPLPPFWVQDRRSYLLAETKKVTRHADWAQKGTCGLTRSSSQQFVLFFYPSPSTSTSPPTRRTAPIALSLCCSQQKLVGVSYKLSRLPFGVCPFFFLAFPLESCFSRLQKQLPLGFHFCFPPPSALAVTMGLLDFRKKEEEETAPVSISEVDPAFVAPESDKMITLSVAACGAGLFSDGYVNNVSTGRALLAMPSFPLSPGRPALLANPCSSSPPRSSAPSPPCSACATATPGSTPTPRASSVPSPLPAPSSASSSLASWPTAGRAQTPCWCPPSSSSSSRPWPPARTGTATRLACSTS